MADIDLKTESPDASINDSAFLFGADSQSAASPSVYSVGTVRAHFVGAGTLNVASGKTLTASNTLTLAGTDGTTMTFPSTSATLARTDAGNTFTGAQTFSIGTVNGTGLDLTQTWSGTGTYTGLQYNVTDSGPANAASLLMNLQVGAASQFRINKSGRIFSVSPSTSWSTTGLDEVWRLNTATAGDGAVVIGYSAGVTSLLLGTSAYPGLIRLGTDVNISRRGAANLRLGAADTTGTTAPTAQTLSVQSWASSTNNNQPGADFTITGSQGTGTGAGGSIIFRVAPAGSTANGVQNALVTGLRIDSTIHPNGGLGISSTGGNNLFLYYFGGGGIFFGDAFANIFGGFVTNGHFRLGADVNLLRDDANKLALRNSTNAQEFRVYNTFTSSTNFERFRIFAQSAGSVIIGTEKGSGGGTARALELQTDGTTRLTIVEDGRVGIGSTANNTTLGVTTSLTLANWLYFPNTGGIVFDGGSQNTVAQRTFNSVNNLVLASENANAILSSGDTAWSALGGRVASGGEFTWSSVTHDALLYAFAQNDLVEQRRRNNGQTFRIYGRYTSGTNFERFFVASSGTSGSAVQLGTQKGSGGGTACALELQTDATTRLTLTTLGSVVVNTAAVATTATDGFLYVPTCAGTPTGTPTTQTGTAPIVVDTTNNKLYFYSGGAWRDAGP